MSSVLLLVCGAVERVDGKELGISVLSGDTGHTLFSWCGMLVERGLRFTTGIRGAGLLAATGLLGASFLIYRSLGIFLVLFRRQQCL